MKTKLSALFLLPFISFSQDVITNIDGSTINAKILEISKNEIKYKKTNYLDGPLIIIDKKDISQIKYENGDIEIFQQTTSDKEKVYAEKEKSDISSIFNKGNKVFLEKSDDANNDALEYFKNSLKKWNYWQIVENKSDADFIIVFSLKKKLMGDRKVKATLLTLSGKTYLETKSYAASQSAFSGYNGSRTAANRLVEKYFAKKFK
ncbi:hypothetical protein LG651_03155 [Tamlana sp. 62-3]|uniref:Uncharacterized protein n=1 Tax=Neotamlana sargassicola TaxID=2883125 RepID=A0A9X1I5J2_9FLAO|nr:hypothetical protein [Tamlana sargassicola]MCB4807235.1 hypothetical protein [Tamlana sargassicola]